MLLQGGANANAEDAGGQKPIHAAAAEQHEGIVEVLLAITTPDADNTANWTVDGIIQEAQQAIADDQPQEQQHQVSLADQVLLVIGDQSNQKRFQQNNL